jgi:hypothetical protein
MPWTTLNPTSLPTWNVTDIALLKRMQYLLLEAPNGSDADGATLLTDMFSITEMIDILNQRQEKFIRDTACIQRRVSQPSVAGTARYLLPPDWIHTRRLSWQIAGGQTKALVRTDAYQLDHGLADWQQNLANPTVYNDGSDLPTLTVEIAKAPANNGTMVLGYIPQPTTLNGIVGAPVNLNIPDEMAECGVLWGVLADLLGSDGPAHDPERAAFCEMRYSLAVDMAKLLMESNS